MGAWHTRPKGVYKFLVSRNKGLILSYVRGTSTRNNPPDTLSSHPSISPAPCTFLSPVRDISKVATIIRWTRTFTRLHRPEIPVFNARVREQGEGGRVLLYLTLRMQIPRVQGDMISSASPQASRSSIVIRVSDQPFKDKEPGKM